jgi:ABC-type sugar transport system substrate-binding protein
MSARWVDARRRMLCCAVVAGVVLGVTGCGASDGFSTGSSEAAVESSQLKAAKERVDELMKVPTDIGITEPLKGSMKGKSLVIMSCGVPGCRVAAGHLADAAAAMGMTSRTINTGASPSDIASAYNAAVAAKPDVLFSSAVPTQLFRQQLQELIDGGTKVVLYNTAPPIPSGAIALYTDEDTAAVGQATADYVVADAEGEPVNVLYVNLPEFTALKAGATAFTDQMSELCPSCSVTPLRIKAGDIGTSVGGKVVSELSRDPSIDYVVFQTGDSVVGVPQALKVADLNPTIVTSTGTQPNWEHIQSGQQQAAVTNYFQTDYWAVLDAAARATSGQEIPDRRSPIGIITKENMTFAPSIFFARFGSDYEAQFKKIWNVE